MKIIDYLLFRLKAKDEYSIHSPFLFDLYTNTLKNRNSFSFISGLSDVKFLVCSKKKKSITNFPFYTSFPDRYEKIIYRLLKKFRFDSLVQVSFKGETLIYTLYLKAKTSNYFSKMKESKGLSSILEITPTLGMVFFDKNCPSDKINSITENLFAHISNDSIFIFEKPHHSKENYFLWSSFASFKEITLSLDLYFVGISFFRNALLKQSFELKV